MHIRGIAVYTVTVLGRHTLITRALNPPVALQSHPNDANCARRGRRRLRLNEADAYSPMEGFRRQWIPTRGAYKLRAITIIPFSLFHAKTYNFIKVLFWKQTLICSLALRPARRIRITVSPVFRMLSFAARLRIIEELTVIMNDLISM